MLARAVAAGDTEGVLRQRMREVTSRLLVRHFSSIPADQACTPLPCTLAVILSCLLPVRCE